MHLGTPNGGFPVQALCKLNWQLIMHENGMISKVKGNILKLRDGEKKIIYFVLLQVNQRQQIILNMLFLLFGKPPLATIMTNKTKKMEMTREDNYENQNPAKRVSSLTLCSSKGNNDSFKNCMFSIFKCQQHIH